MHERACITNKAYIRAADHKTLLRRLKYWTFREDRDHQIPQDRGEERWRDRGLGQDYHTIFANCQRFATQGLNNDVAARTLVISPETHLMQTIPEADRQSVLEELTERVVEGWFDRATAVSASRLSPPKPSSARLRRCWMMAERFN